MKVLAMLKALNMHRLRGTPKGICTEEYRNVERSEHGAYCCNDRDPNPKRCYLGIKLKAVAGAEPASDSANEAVDSLCGVVAKIVNQQLLESSSF